MKIVAYLRFETKNTEICSKFQFSNSHLTFLNSWTDYEQLLLLNILDVILNILNMKNN